MYRMLATALSLLLLALPAFSASWQGQVVNEEGKKVVKNPEAPIEKTPVTLKPLWNRGHEDDDVFFGLPAGVVHDEKGNVFILDSQVSEIVVLDPSGEYLRTIGREGEGPGEFRNGSSMFITPDQTIGVVTIFPGKVVQLGPEGEPRGIFRLPGGDGEGFQLVFLASSTQNNRVVLSGGKASVNGGNEQENYLKLFDGDGNELATYGTMMEDAQFGGRKFDEKDWTVFKMTWTVAPDGRVALARGFDEYEIDVFNSDGSLAYVISRPEYTNVDRTGEEVELYQKMFDGYTRWNPNSTFKVSPNHRAIQQLTYRADGTLWVLSGQGVWARGAGVFAVFDVYDKDGRFARQVVMNGEGDSAIDAVYFAGSRMYRVSNQLDAIMANIGGASDEGAVEETDPLQIYAYEVDPTQLGMNR